MLKLVPLEWMFLGSFFLLFSSLTAYFSTYNLLKCTCIPWPTVTQTHSLNLKLAHAAPFIWGQHQHCYSPMRAPKETRHLRTNSCTSKIQLNLEWPQSRSLKHRAQPRHPVSLRAISSKGYEQQLRQAHRLPEGMWLQGTLLYLQFLTWTTWGLWI